MQSSIPSKNKTVLITRAKEQSDDMIHLLEKNGFDIVALPLIQFQAINASQLLSVFHSTLFNWIIFTSTNTVKFFLKTILPSNLSGVKIAAVGKKTAQLLEDEGLDVSVIPSDFTADALGRAIPVLSHEKVFIPHSALSSNNLQEQLEAKNAAVQTLAIYDNHAVNYSKEELSSLLPTTIDVVTFTSGSCVKAYVANNIHLPKAKIVCIGPSTAKVAKEMNLVVDVIPEEYTVEGMVNSIKQLFP